MTWALDSVTRLRRNEWAPDIAPLIDELALIFGAFAFPSTGTGQVSTTPNGSNVVTLPPFPDLNFPAIDIPSLLGGSNPNNPGQQDQGDDQNGTTDTTKDSFVRFSAPAVITTNNSDGSYVATLFPSGFIDESQYSINLHEVNSDQGLTAGQGVLVTGIIKLSVTTTTTKQNGAIVSTSTSVQVTSQIYYCQIGGGGGGAVPGKIVSGGPGQGPYIVTIYPSGTANDSQGNPPATQDVKVTQLQIDPAETLPADTWVLVTKVGGAFYMQVAVYL